MFRPRRSIERSRSFHRRPCTRCPSKRSSSASRTSGLLHALLGLTTRRDVEGHPKLGASFEGFVIDQLLQQLRVRAEDAYFWRTHTGAELDLLVVHGGRRLGFEIKRTSSPAPTPSMRIALADLKLSSLCVVHAGAQSYPLAKNADALSWTHIVERVKPLD